MSERQTQVAGPAQTDSPLRPMLVVAAFLVCSNGLVAYLSVHVLHASAQWDDRAVRTWFVATAAACVLAVLLDSQRQSNRRLFVPPLAARTSMIAFSAAIVASSLWSVDHVLTRERSLIYVGLAALAWIIADLDFARLRRVLMVTLLIVLSTSLLAVVVSDSIGLDHNGAWQGLFVNPNELAALAALGLLVGFTTAVGATGRNRVMPALIGIIGMVLLVGSRSLTAWVALLGAVTIAFLVWLSAVRRERLGSKTTRDTVVAATIGVVVIFGAALAAWNSSALAPRRIVWEFVWERIAERPLLGHGWFTFWEAEDFVAFADFVAPGELVGASNAYNSFLEVWLGGGLLALIPFVVIVALALWGSTQTLWREPSLQSWTWCTLVVFLVAVNLTASFVLWFSYNWVLVMSAALRGARPVGTASA